MRPSFVLPVLAAVLFMAMASPVRAADDGSEPEGAFTFQSTRYVITHLSGNKYQVVSPDEDDPQIMYRDGHVLTQKTKVSNDASDQAMRFEFSPDWSTIRFVVDTGATIHRVSGKATAAPGGPGPEGEFKGDEADCVITHRHGDQYAATVNGGAPIDMQRKEHALAWQDKAKELRFEFSPDWSTFHVYTGAEKILHRMTAAAAAQAEREAQEHVRFAALWTNLRKAVALEDDHSRWRNALSPDVAKEAVTIDSSQDERYSFYFAEESVSRDRSGLTSHDDHETVIADMDESSTPDGPTPTTMAQTGCHITRSIGPGAVPVPKRPYLILAAGYPETGAPLDCWTISNLPRVEQDGTPVSAGVPFHEPMARAELSKDKSHAKVTKARDDAATKARDDAATIAKSIALFRTDTGRVDDACLSTVSNLTLAAATGLKNCGDATKLRSCAEVTPGWVCYGGPYLASIPLDPWGHPFVAKVNISNYVITVRSAGPDGKMNTADDVTYDH